jgi:hypothetical protein
MNLQAPEIRRVFSSAEIDQVLPDPDEQYVNQETVEVEGTRPAPDVPPGIMSLPWAARHPSQAWRIFLPVPSAK